MGSDTWGHPSPQLSCHLKWVDTSGSHRRGANLTVPDFPLHPEAWWVLSRLLAPLSGPIPRFSPQGPGGEGGVGDAC